jgi:hypothetical protein
MMCYVYAHTAPSQQMGAASQMPIPSVSGPRDKAGIEMVLLTGQMRFAACWMTGKRMLAIDKGERQ